MIRPMGGARRPVDAIEQYPSGELRHDKRSSETGVVAPVLRVRARARASDAECPSCGLPRVPKLRWARALGGARNVVLLYRVALLVLVGTALVL